MYISVVLSSMDLASTQDWIIILTDSSTLSIIAYIHITHKNFTFFRYDIKTKQIVTKLCHNIQDNIGRPVEVYSQSCFCIASLHSLCQLFELIPPKCT